MNIVIRYPRIPERAILSLLEEFNVDLHISEARLKKIHEKAINLSEELINPGIQPDFPEFANVYFDGSRRPAGGRFCLLYGDILIRCMSVSECSRAIKALIEVFVVNQNKKH